MGARLLVSLVIVVAVHTGDCHWIVNWIVNWRVTAYIIMLLFPQVGTWARELSQGVTIGSWLHGDSVR